MPGWMIALIVVGIILLIIIIWVITTYNKFIKLKNKVEEAFSTMDVYLKKRWDLIPNVVETVKGYASHESETLENLTKFRNINYNSLSDEEKVETNTELGNALSRLLVTIENYPDLKASENFSKLQTTLESIEAEISNSRKYYNGSVKEYNNLIESFPSNIIAKIFNFVLKPFYEIAEAERENPEIKF